MKALTVLVEPSYENIAALFAAGFRAGIVELEALVTQRAPAADRRDARDYPLRHFTDAPGQYAREITIPAGQFIIGRIHRHAHINVLSKGRVIVWTEEGEAELEAPLTFVSKPGTKRALLTLEETVWTTVHATDETDIERIDADLIAPSYAALEDDHVR